MPKPIPLPVKPAPLVPVVSQRIEFQIGPDRGAYDVTILREPAAAKNKRRAPVRPIALRRPERR